MHRTERPFVILGMQNKQTIIIILIIIVRIIITMIPRS